jgi:hypothetical protein
MAIDRQLLFELSHFLMIDFPSIPFHRALHLLFDDISFACPPSNEMNDFFAILPPQKTGNVGSCIANCVVIGADR